MVAKSFQSMTQVGEPYISNGKMYVKVLNEKTGNSRIVRWYTDSEYYKMYPEAKTEQPAATSIQRSQKLALGFDKGYITIFKGDTQPHNDWFKFSVARYATCWGWYIISTKEVPADLPTGLTPVRLPWEMVGTDKDVLKTDAEVKAAVESLMYEESKSKHIGKVGDRLELEIVVTENRKLDTLYGHANAITMQDSNENVYIWITSAKNWSVGESKRIRGTVKEHKIYKNIKRTILVRCTEV